MRAPLSWLRDFAPFGGDPADLAATLDDLGLVVEGVQRVGEGLEDVVVARVVEITAIEGADRIRRVVVDAGDGPLEVVCGATNVAEGDLVPFAPVGAVLPDGTAMTRRTMKGVVSNGMLCSGRELGLSEDGAGLLVLGDVAGARPGLPLTEALAIEPDVVFDITVEGNRPDAWSMAGVARDLAARLRLPFALPEPAPGRVGGAAVGELATLVLEDRELCPRITVRVLTEVQLGPSPPWMARRLTLAGMRPINNVVDASNYVMLELGQPTHPYDLDRLPGHGLRVRRARPGEVLRTLDGVTRSLGTPGRGLGDTGEDCVICDARDSVVGIGGIIGGASSEITGATSRVLLEAAYFTPMAIARTSRRLGVRTEASARFERGCDPWGLDRAAARFCELLADRATVAPGTLEQRGELAGPRRLPVPVDRVNALLGTGLDGEAVAALLEPLGFGCEPAGATLSVTVPTNRPDVRPAPFGVADVVEEVGRAYGYSRLPRRQPSWPSPGGLTPYQRDRRRARDVMVGLGGLEAWTPTFVADGDHVLVGLGGPSVAVANPLNSDEATLRRSLLPGLLRALAYNRDRRQGEVRLFEVGTVFEHPGSGEARTAARAGSGGKATTLLPVERELLAAAFAEEGDDARTAVAAWWLLAEALRLSGPTLTAAGDLPGLHPTRSARVTAASGTELGAVGEVDPAIARALGVGTGRVGWLALDLGLLLDPAVVDRAPEEIALASRFPSSDVDLALVVDDTVPAAEVTRALARAGGPLLESVVLFDVFRGEGIGPGRRSLAFRLRFCAPDRTLTDAEVGELRQRCIDAAVEVAGAVLR